MKKTTPFEKTIGFVKDFFPLILFALILVIFIGGVRLTANSQKSESLKVATESINRAVISCYAVEGSYPETYEYLKENYGLKIDESKYTVFYEIFASNIMPNISVIER